MTPIAMKVLNLCNKLAPYYRWPLKKPFIAAERGIAQARNTFGGRSAERRKRPASLP